MKNKILNLIKSPSFSVFLFTTAMLAVLWAYGYKKNNENLAGNTNPTDIKVSAEIVTSPTNDTNMNPVTSVLTSNSKTNTTTSISTAATTSSAVVSTQITSSAIITETAETESGTESDEIPSPGQPLSPYLYAGESPNSEFYQERLAIAGDSIASGFNIYGYIPTEHNIATESVGIWSYGNFTFDFGYGEMGLVDAVAYMQPKLLYISMGMNDMPNNSPDWFADEYYNLIAQILEKVPDTNIVAAGVTPVADYVSYTTNENIRSYNSALENMINNIGSPQIYYFDAYSVLADSGTFALSSEYSAGDGIHISSDSYNVILTALFNFLDNTPVMEQIISTES
ncbi:MAG: SGNH/GDSL hydrolase family protein [Ruminococcus flavefaciens]|nr:SGNH/GDSL hydrolase family protein [Ruminococcus flavefaciens]MCM1060809.1 SGNH/GDSL hydrolase family protein [Eubacterium sp.]